MSWVCREKTFKFELRFLVVIDFSNCLNRKISVIVIIVNNNNNNNNNKEGIY